MPLPVRRLCIGRFQVGQHCDDAFRGNAHNQRLRLPASREPGGGYWGEVLGLPAFGHVSAEGKDFREVVANLKAGITEYFTPESPVEE